MTEGRPQHQKYMRSLVLRLWHTFLVALWRWHPGRTWHFSLQEAPLREHSAQLQPGCYLFCAQSCGVDAVAITDLLHPERRAAWLLSPGWNVLWIRFHHVWSQPVFEWLGGKTGVRPAVNLAGKRTWTALGALAGLLRVSFFDGFTEVVVADYRVLWPAPQMSPQDRLYRWAMSVPFLTYLNLERFALQRGEKPTKQLSVSTSAHIPQVSCAAQLGAVAHLHYLEHWPEIRDALRQLPRGARVFLTVSDCALPSGDITAQAVVAEMTAERPDAFIQLTPNVGRDLAPFMRLLAAGSFDELVCVCKVHGKGSLRGQKKSLFGEVWRRYAIETLLPDTESIERIGQFFIANPQLGILGPARLRLPSNRVGKTLDEDQGLLRRLMLSRFDRDFSQRIDFFAGTMFWFRPQALRLLKHPPADGWIFPPEPAPTEGTLAHALERLLPTSASLAGYSVESLPDSEGPR